MEGVGGAGVPRASARWVPAKEHHWGRRDRQTHAPPPSSAASGDGRCPLAGARVGLGGDTVRGRSEAHNSAQGLLPSP